MNEFEVEASELLERYGEIPPATWARKWAELHNRWGIPCWGFPTWAAWATAVSAS